MIDCNRCGKCCYYLHKDKVVKCGNLLKLKEGGTRCRVYSSRIGRPIGHNFHCGLRKNSAWNFEGCPYNSLNPEKPMFPKVVQ